MNSRALIKALPDQKQIYVNLMQIIKKLSKLLKKENALLEQLTFKAIEGLQAEKNELIDAFEECKVLLSKYDNLPELYSKKDLAKLINTNNKLQMLIEENKQKLILSIAINAKTTKLVKTIILKNINKKSSYDNQGCYSGKENNMFPMSLIEKI